MGKYFAAYKNSLSSFFQYRLNLGLLLISHAVSLSGLIYLWIAVYADGQTLGSYTLSGILTYYVVLVALRTTTSNGVGMGFQVVDHINEGRITNNLLKPFSYPLEKLMGLLGEGTINTLFMTPVIVLVFWVARETIALPASFADFGLFLLFTLMGLLFYYLFYFLTALSSFWVTHGGNFIYAMIIISSFLNGSVLPLDLFPAWYLEINTYLPFQYLIFVPIQAYLGRIEAVLPTLLIGLLWMAIFSFLIWFVWRLGVKKYEAVGK